MFFIRDIVFCSEIILYYGEYSKIVVLSFSHSSIRISSVVWQAGLLKAQT
jgi:hypothetical protein